MVQGIEDLGCSLESAILYGQNDEVLNFVTSENATLEDIDFLINKLGESLKDSADFPIILDNCLLLIGEIVSIADLSLDQTLTLSRSLLLISSNVKCNILNTKRGLNILNKFLDEQLVATWLVNDKSLERSIVALGRRIFLIGDFECQTVIFEIMCRLALQDVTHWANLWFPTKKLNAKFLALRPDQFELDSRKILNYINRKEPIPRVFSFIAKSVWLGEVQLQKPQGSEFWIDLNFGSLTISFFCSEILNEEEDPPWETVTVLVDMIDKYTISDDPENEVTTLIFNLKCHCNQLISTSSANILFKKDEVKVTFWCPDSNVQRLIARLLEEDHGEEKRELGKNTQADKGRKISISSEISTCDDEFEEAMTVKTRKRKLSDTNHLLKVNDLKESEAVQQKHKKQSEISHMMIAFEAENDPVLPSVHRKLSEIDELLETHEIEDINTFLPKIRKVSQSYEAVTSEEIKESDINYGGTEDIFELNKPESISNKTNVITPQQVKNAIDNVLTTDIMKTNVITPEQVKNAIDDVLTTDIINKEKTNDIDTLKLPMEEESQCFISPTPIKQRIPAVNKTKVRERRLSLSLKSRKKLQNTIMNSPEVKESCVKNLPLVSKKSSDLSDLRDKVVNSTPQMQPKRVKLFNLDSTPVYNKPLTKKSSREKLKTTSLHIKSSQEKLETTKLPLKLSQEKLEATRFTLESSQNKNISTNNNEVSKKTIDIEEKSSDEGSLKAKCSQKAKSSHQKNLVVKEQVDLPLTQVQVTSPSMLHKPMVAEIDDLASPCLTLLSEDELKVETNYKRNIENEKKKNLPSSKKENISKKKIKNKFRQSYRESSNEESSEKTSLDKSLEKKTKRKKTERFNNSDEDFESSNMSKKKPRAAALKAMKMNKNMLEEKNSEINSMQSQVIKRKDINISEDDVSSYSPKKKKSKGGSIFHTDTETQSSEVSWYKRAKHGLFRTPPLKNYSKKNKKCKTSWSGKRQRKKGSRKQTKFFDNKSINSGTRSKSLGLSDLDNFSLVIEKNSPQKLAPATKVPEYQFKFLDIANEMRTYVTDKDINHTVTNDKTIGDDCNQEFLAKPSLPINRKDNANTNSKGNKGFKIKPVTQNGKFPQLIDIKINNQKPNLLNVAKKNMEENDRMILKKMTKSHNVFPKIQSDLCLTHQNSIDFKTQKNSEFEGNEIIDNFPPDEVLTDCESKNDFADDLKFYDKSDDLSEANILDTEKDVERNLSFESLKSLHELNDEDSGKKLHMDFFLESISSASPLPLNDFEEFSPCQNLSSKRSSSHCSHSKNDLPCKKFKTDKKGNGSLNDQQFSQKKTIKKAKRKSNRSNDSIVMLNRKSEKIFIPSNKKSCGPPKLPNKRCYKDDLRVQKNMFENNAAQKKMSSKENIESRKNMSNIVVATLASEVNLLTRKLFATLQKCTLEFSNELNALRSNFLFKIEDMITYNTNLSEKELKKLAANCKESRLLIQTNMKQLMEIGREYFEAERKREEKLRCVHKKITVKYYTHLRAAVEVAVKSIEERIFTRVRALFKKFLLRI